MQKGIFPGLCCTHPSCIGSASLSGFLHPSVHAPSLGTPWDIYAAHTHAETHPLWVSRARASERGFSVSAPQGVPIIKPLQTPLARALPLSLFLRRCTPARSSARPPHTKRTCETTLFAIYLSDADPALRRCSPCANKRTWRTHTSGARGRVRERREMQPNLMLHAGDHVNTQHMIEPPHTQQDVSRLRNLIHPTTKKAYKLCWCGFWRCENISLEYITRKTLWKKYS